MPQRPPSISHSSVRESVQRWFQRFVLELNLCPFAARDLAVQDCHRLRIQVTAARSEQELLQALADELLYLQTHDQVETTLLAHPHVLADFLDYNDFLGVVDELLQTSALEGVFQVASFHPDYQFAGTRPDAAENFANRSPYPLLHILREASVSAAVDSHPDIELIVQRNAEVLEGLGSADLQARWQACLVESADDS